MVEFNFMKAPLYLPPCANFLLWESHPSLLRPFIVGHAGKAFLGRERSEREDIASRSRASNNNAMVFQLKLPSSLKQPNRPF